MATEFEILKDGDYFPVIPKKSKPFVRIAVREMLAELPFASLFVNGGSGNLVDGQCTTAEILNLVFAFASKTLRLNLLNPVAQLLDPAAHVHTHHAVRVSD
jgi:hypothetical protein